MQQIFTILKKLIMVQMNVGFWIFILLHLRQVYCTIFFYISLQQPLGQPWGLFPVETHLKEAS